MVFVNGFCGNSTFWDSNISWNTTSPDLSNCFKSTVLVWVPCAVFWTWTMYELTIAYRSRNRPNKWSFLHIVKQILNTGMLLLSVVKFISSIVIYSEEDNRHIELSNVIGNSIESVTYILVVLLTAYSRRKGILVSNALPLFWILQSAYYASLTYSNYNRTNENFSLEQLTIIVDLISTAISPLMLILSSFCETPSSFEVLNNEDDIQENCPGKKNSLFSFVTFSWANKIIINGLKSTFQIDQLDPLCKELRSAVVTKIYDRSFQNSARAIRDRDSDPEVLIQRPVKTPLVKTLWKISWWPFILGAIFELIAIFLTFCPPYLLSKLLNFVDSTELNWHGYVYAILFWLIIIIESIVDSLSQYFCMVASVQVKNALISAVYRKILLLSNSAKTKYTAGEIVNLMAIDSQEIFEFTTYVYQFLGIPLRISLTLWYLWYYLGPSSLASLAVFAVLSPISSVLGVKVDYYQEQVMLQKDKRLKQMSEILNGIKILKLYAWEKPFIKQVLETRSEELSYLKKGAYLNSFFAFLWIVAPFLVCIVCFTTFLLSNTSHQLTAEIAFVSLSLIGLLRFPMGVLPDLLTRFIKVRIS